MTKVGNTYNESFKISGDWEIQASKLRERFPELKEEDLLLEDGKENELLKRIEAKLEKSRNEVIHIIKKGRAEKSELL